MSMRKFGRAILIDGLLVACVAAVLWGFARHETRSGAWPDAGEDASAVQRGAAAFEGADFGGISMAALETHAMPWRLVSAALVMDARSRDPSLPVSAETLDRVLSGFGFLTRAQPVNRPLGLSGAVSDMPLGLTYGDLAPVGGAKIRVTNLGCAACHAGVTYDADGLPEPEKAWLGMPNTSLDLQAYTTGVLGALRYATADENALLETAASLYPDMGWREEQTLRWLVLPLVKEKLDALQGAEQPLPFPNGVPGSTNGVAALKFKSGVPLAAQGPGDAGIVSIPDLGYRHLRSSLLTDGAYAVPGSTRQKPMTNEDADRRHLDALATITTFFTVPSMGVHPDKAIGHLPEANDIFAFLSEAYRPQTFPGTVDEKAARAGEALFQNECSSCHGEYTWTGEAPRLSGFPNWIGEAGTDPLRASLFTDALTNSISQTVYGSKIAPARTGKYVAPPLSGVWASAPYLHNGSVPTLHHLLNPAERPVRFQLGGHALDFERVGLRLGENGAFPADYVPFSNPVWFDTRGSGNGNGGHDFGAELGEDEKRQLIEYLKLL